MSLLKICLSRVRIEVSRPCQLRIEISSVNENKFYPEGPTTTREQVEGEITIGERRFAISYSTGWERFHGSIRPDPAHETVMVRHPELEEELPNFPELATTPTQTILKFTIYWASQERQKGQFREIEITPEERRRGWGSDMVRGLLTFFPTTYWHNQELNEQSGPLFIKMHAEYPDRIAAVTDTKKGLFLISRNPLESGGPL